MTSDPKVTDNIVFLRAKPEFGFTPKSLIPKGHPRGILLVRVDRERQTVSLSASVMSHTEPRTFDKNDGVAYAAQRTLSITAPTAKFQRCENSNKESKEWKAHHKAALEQAERMAFAAILATGATQETLEMIDMPPAQSVLTAIIYALQGRGGVNVAEAIKVAEAKRAEEAEKAARAAQVQAVATLEAFMNDTRQRLTEMGLGAQFAQIEAFANKLAEEYCAGV